MGTATSYLGRDAASGLIRARTEEKIHCPPPVQPLSEPGSTSSTRSGTSTAFWPRPPAAPWSAACCWDRWSRGAGICCRSWPADFCCSMPCEVLAHR